MVPPPNFTQRDSGDSENKVADAPGHWSSNRPQHPQRGSGHSPAILSHSIEQIGTEADGRTFPPFTDQELDTTALTNFLRTTPNSLAFLTTMFASVPVPWSIVNRRGQIVASNAAMRRIFGATPPPEYSLFTDNLVKEHNFLPAIERAFAGMTVELPIIWYDIRNLTNIEMRDGRKVALSTTVFPISHPGETIDHIGLIYRDDTAVMHAQDNLRAQSEHLEQHIIDRTAALEEANDELEAFSYSVSHDLRTPLRAIDGFAAILSEDETSTFSTTGRDYLRRIRAAASRMSDLINDLLVFSRKGKQALTMKSVDPHLLVTQALQEVESKIADRQVDIHIGKLPICQADPALLREVFSNLLDNAIKFTRPRPLAKIDIGSRLQNGRLVWYVADNGVGFDMEHYDRLFNVFSRLHSTEQFEGTGVGLALVSRIIRRHGGQVWAQSTPGKGATFFFTLGEAQEEDRE